MLTLYFILFVSSGMFVPVMENKVAPRIMVGRLACILGHWGIHFSSEWKGVSLRGTSDPALATSLAQTIFKTMKYQAQGMAVLLNCGKRDHLYSI